MYYHIHIFTFYNLSNDCLFSLTRCMVQIEECRINDCKHKLCKIVMQDMQKKKICFHKNKAIVLSLREHSNEILDAFFISTITSSGIH